MDCNEWPLVRGGAVARAWHGTCLSLRSVLVLALQSNATHAAPMFETYRSVSNRGGVGA